jgi:hypothetical protein
MIKNVSGIRLGSHVSSQPTNDQVSWCVLYFQREYNLSSDALRRTTFSPIEIRMLMKAVLMQPKDYGTAIQISPSPWDRFSDVLLTWQMVTQFCTILNTAFFAGARPSTLFQTPAYHSPLKIKHVWIQRVVENEMMLGFSFQLSLAG